MVVSCTLPVLPPASERTTSFENAKAYRLRLEDPTDTDTMPYQEVGRDDDLFDTEVEVEMKAVGFTAKVIDTECSGQLSAIINILE